ncbi:hypothetical protein ACJIZ3_008949 [Penstemon smallii]|uniref:Uncharacterized protein n=1 Tax=Penstemon smallii TaxID=265156 RepID=A0ABD3TDE2_9LAMI
MGTKLEKKDHKECSSCLGFQDIITKVNGQCTLLELDIEKKNSVIKRLEDEVKLLKLKNEDLEKSILIGKEEEEDKILQLSIENKTLECEKQMAESQVKALKEKCEELEMQVMELQKRSSLGTMRVGVDVPEMDSSVQVEKKATNEDKDASAGTPTINTPSKQYTDSDGIKPSVRKCLDFANEGSTFKDISPTTPGGSKPPFDPICISDSDDDENITPLQLPNLDSNGRKNVHSSSNVGLGITQDEILSDEDISFYNRKRKMPKKRRVSNIVTSESESEFNGIGSSSKDNKRKKRRRRLIKKGSGDEKGIPGNSPYENTRSKTRFEIPTTKNETSEEDFEDGSDSESLSEFIVKSSDDSDEISEHDNTTNSDEMSLEKIMRGIRRERKDKKEWDFEGDMLADLGKCSKLCMKAVCAIYRQQTSEEKSCKATIVHNGRGFSQIHAFMGSELAEFLTDGDPQGDVTKSVDELREFDPKGVENCEKLARNYSKQLFEIYKNGNDPFFKP